MKNLFVFLLFVLISLSCSRKSKNQISILPKFIIGDQYDYTIAHSLKHDGSLDFQQISDVTITVEKVQDTIVTLKWIINKVEFTDSTELKDFRSSIFKISEGMTITYDVNQKGQIQQIDNYNTIQKNLDAKFDSVMIAISQKASGDSTYKKSSGFGIIKAMIYSEPERNIIISDIFHFNRLNGIDIQNDTCVSFYESWVGTKMDEYRICLNQKDNNQITLHSDLVTDKIKSKNGRVTKRVYTYDRSNYWLKDFSSIMTNDKIEDKMLIERK